MINATNKITKLITSLSKKKYRNKEGLFLVEGYRFVADIPKTADIAFYGVTEEFLQENRGFPYIENREIYVFSSNDFNKLSDTVSPQGILAVCKQLSYDYSSVVDKMENGLLIIAEAVRDPGNLGAIIRTAEAAGAKGIFLSKDTVDIYNQKVLRSTMGSIFNIAVFPEIDVGETIIALKKDGISIIGTSLKTETDYTRGKYSGNSAIIIGNEAEGISNEAAELCDCLVKIPIYGKAESLNASVAAGIVIYEAVRHKKRG